MSIRDKINLLKELVRNEELVPIEAFIGDETKRQLFVSREIAEYLNGNENEDSWAAMSAIMQSYVAGNKLSAGKGQIIALLEPNSNGICQLRSTTKPAIRIFGYFVKRDFFIGLEWSYRKNLGEANSKEYKRIIRNCKAKWRARFHSYVPLTGGKYHEYLTNIFINRDYK